MQTLYNILPHKFEIYLKKLMSSEINSYLIKGAFWVISSTIISKLLVILASLVNSRLLGQTIYGEFAIIRSTINMFTAYTGLGIALTSTKYISEYRKKNKEKTARIIALSNVIVFFSGLFFVCVIIVFAPIICQKMLKAPSLIEEIRLGSFIMFFTGLNALQLGILSGFQCFKIIAKNSLWAGFFAFFAQIYGCYFWGLDGSIVGLGTGFLILWLFNFFSIRKITRNQYYISFFSKSIFKELPILWQFSMPTFLTAIVVESTIWAGNAILVSQPNGFNEMAIFDISNQWRIAIVFIPSILSQLTLPLLSSNVDDEKTYSSIFFKNLKINTIISITIGIVFAAFSPLILKLYGESYVSTKFVLILLVVSTVLTSINSLIWQITVSNGDMWLNFIINVFWGSVLIVSAYLFSKYLVLNALNMAFSYLIAYCVQTGLLFIYFKYYQKLIKI
ncbi:oligosaccharide flippase family protein [Emticicia sp.]|uniref:oligosaccharide flippase family protein n=1 Tax=Emticicia sp. TaxID=1930953 RepID=UPI003753E7CE